MIFILGPRRSGTSLCRALIGSHPNVVIPPTDVGVLDIDLYFEKYGIDLGIEKLRKNEKLKEWKLDIDKIEKIIRSSNKSIFISRIIYNEFFSKYPDKVKIVKRPTYEKNWRYIKELYPEVRFIYMVRDPRAIVSSRKYFGKKISDRNELVRYSRNINKLYKYYKEIQDISIKIRYEDLVNNPKEELKKICNFIEIDYTDDMLNFSKYWGLDENQSSFDIDNKKIIYNSSIDRWKNKLTEDEIRIIENINRLYMKEGGY